jgi:glycosyltransferase involved in cell wall biosynthesis
MRDVEISRPIDPTPGRKGPGPFQALVRWHGIPLGRSIEPPARRGGAAVDLTAALVTQHSRNLLQQLVRAVLQSPQPRDRLRLHDLAHATPTPYDGPWPLVTVAVCTRDRAADLARCLDGVLALDYPALDLLVVDNAPSSDTTARLVADRFPRVRYVVESRPGLDWARNRAVHEARGEILAFTDDDAVVDRDWVSALVRVFTQDPDVMAVTGLVIPYELETEAQHLFEQYGGFGRGYTRQWYSVSRRPDRADYLYLGAGLYGTGTNMAFRRRVFASLGEFDPALDVGTVTQGGGDLDMFFRVLQHGLILVYEPAAVVRHRHRRTLTELDRQLVGWGSGFYAYLSRNAVVCRPARWAIIRFGLWYFWVRYLRRLGLSLLRSPTVPRRLILAELRGALLGLPRYRRARATAARIAASWPGHAGSETAGPH